MQQNNSKIIDTHYDPGFDSRLANTKNSFDVTPATFLIKTFLICIECIARWKKSSRKIKTNREKIFAGVAVFAVVAAVATVSDQQLANKITQNFFSTLSLPHFASKPSSVFCCCCCCCCCCTFLEWEKSSEFFSTLSWFESGRTSWKIFSWPSSPFNRAQGTFSPWKVVSTKM